MVGVAALDARIRTFDPPEMDAKPMRILGRLNKTPWQRFVRLQQTVAKLNKDKGQPKGVFRFSSHEECEAWTKNLKGP